MLFFTATLNGFWRCSKGMLLKRYSVLYLLRMVAEWGPVQWTRLEAHSILA